jgi:hypothetical protein
MIHKTPLLTAILRATDTYALYSLQHAPTKSLYFGSTSALRKRLEHWAYNLKGVKPFVGPARMKLLLNQYGRTPNDWDVTVLDTTMPPGYQPRAGGIRPETASIQWALKNAPTLLLNDPEGASRGRPPGKKYKPPNTWGPRGVTPLRYLSDQLGVSGRPKWNTMPPTSSWIDTRTLVPVGSPHVPFAMYLLRAMKGGQPKHMNPSPAAIADLYADWLKQQPLGRPAGAPGTISDVDAALAVPHP